MARYDYHCTVCDKTFEVEHPMTEHPEISCPDCHEPADRVFSATGISFKGSGFYNTDHGVGSVSAPQKTDSGAHASETSSAAASSETSSSSCTHGACACCAKAS